MDAAHQTLTSQPRSPKQAVGCHRVVGYCGFVCVLSLFSGDVMAFHPPGVKGQGELDAGLAKNCHTEKVKAQGVGWKSRETGPTGLA